MDGDSFAHVFPKHNLRQSGEFPYICAFQVNWIRYKKWISS